jgi:hypothetical protein
MKEWSKPWKAISPPNCLKNNFWKFFAKSSENLNVRVKSSNRADPPHNIGKNFKERPP